MVRLYNLLIIILLFFSDPAWAGGSKLAPRSAFSKDPDISGSQAFKVPEDSGYYSSKWEAIDIDTKKKYMGLDWGIRVDREFLTVLDELGIRWDDFNIYLKRDFLAVKWHLNAASANPKAFRISLVGKGPYLGGNCRADGSIIINRYYKAVALRLKEVHGELPLLFLRFLWIHEFIHELGNTDDETLVDTVNILLFEGLKERDRILGLILFDILDEFGILDRESHFARKMEDVIKEKIGEYIPHLEKLISELRTKGDMELAYTLVIRGLLLVNRTLDTNLVSRLSALASTINVLIGPKRRYLVERRLDFRRGDLDLSIPDLEGFPVDFPHAKLEVGKEGRDITYLRRIIAIEEELGRQKAALTKMGVWPIKDKKIMVVGDIGHFILRVEEKEGRTEFTHNPGLMAIMRDNPNIHFGFKVDKDRRGVIEKALSATGLLGRQIHLFDKDKGLTELQQDAVNLVEGLEPNHVVFLLGQEAYLGLKENQYLRDNIRGNHLKVIGIQGDSTFHYVMLFAVLYGYLDSVFIGNSLTAEAESVLNGLAVFGVRDERIRKIKEELLKDSVFIIRPMSTEEILLEFWVYRFYVETST